MSARAGEEGQFLTKPVEERLADRLEAARRGRFVGRDAELSLFREALLADEPPFAVLYVHGPGGIGKTTLLRELVGIAERLGVSTTFVDGRELEPSPSGFRLALAAATGLDDADPPLEELVGRERRALFVDGFEVLRSLASWLRTELLPMLPAGSVAVIADRGAPGPGWRTDLGWGALTRVLSLRNLRPEESETYLTTLGVPAARHAEVLAFTHGHPLALSIVADLQSQGETLFTPRENPDVLEALLDRIVESVPSPSHRRALETCAHVWVTTEALLADVVGPEAAPEMFAWLRGLSFIERGRRGLMPHDLAREVLDADLRWRNPAAYEEVHEGATRHVAARLREARGRARDDAMAEITYLYRHNPLTKAYYDWEGFGEARAERATAEDHPAIRAMVERHEGPDSAEIVRYWLERRPEGFTLFRRGDDRWHGFVFLITLEGVDDQDADADPAMAAARDHLSSNGPLRPGEEFDYVRFWMAGERYQTAEMNNLVTMVAGPLFREGGRQRSVSFAAVGDAEHWAPFFAQLNFSLSPSASFTVGRRSFGVFVHDWRIEPAEEWSRAMSRRQIGGEPDEGDATARRLLVLSEPDFTAAVRQALRDYTRPAALAANPLLRSRLVFGAAEGEPVPATLQALVREAADSLRSNPRDEKLYRALLHTYLKPAPSQERAAERLQLPFSTYRYHLGKGLARVTEWLWAKELHGPDG